MKFKSTGITSNSIKFLLIFIIIIILVCVYQSQQVFKTGKWITKAQDVLLLSKKILTHTLDNESSFRGYILTGQKTYLQPLATYRKDIYDEIGLLKVLTTDNEPQQKLIDSLILYVNKRIAFSNNNIKRYDLNEANAVMKKVETGEGKSYTDHIRLVVDKIQEIENILLVEHKIAYDKAIGSFEKVLWWLIAGIILVLALFIQKGRLDNIEKGKTAATLKKNE